jgi:hypothetical protein
MRPIYLLAITTAVLFSSLLNSAAQNNQKECGEKFLHQFTYSGKYLDISGETEDARATFWKPDGTIVFVKGRVSNNMAAYGVSDPWQIHTVKFLHDVHVPGEFQHGLFFRENGTMMWVFDRTSIWSFTLENPWDITTRSEGSNHDLSSFTLRGHDIDFKPDGAILFIDDRNAGAVFEYSLITPWDVSTGILTYTLDISEQQIEVRGIEFLKDGSIMMLMDTERKEVMQYNLTRPYEISTATFFDAFDVSEQTYQGRGMTFSTDENIMYVTAQDEKKIFQYEIIK